MGYMEEGKWWVSQANYAESVSGKYQFPAKIEILDTTLRDGEQQAGIIFTQQDKIRIAKMLDASGVHRIEAGTPAVSKEDERAIKEIASLGLNAKLFAFVRNMKEDMKLAKECGVYGVLAEIPGSEHLLKFGKKWTAEKAIAAAIESTAYARELGLYVTFFPADSSRAGLDFLIDVVRQISEHGHMDSLALVDTFGAFSPEGAAYTVKKLKENFSVPIEAHFHDDFGLGTASTIAALAAGAEVAHVTVNGVGERAGSVPLEPLALSLKVLYDQETGIKLEKLKELSNLVVDLSNSPIQAGRPVVGDKIFGWETGMPSSMWLNCKDTQPLAMLPYLWTMTGQTEPRIYLGKKSGKDNLSKWIDDNGLNVPDDQRAELLDKVKELSISLKRDITAEEFRRIVSGLK